MQSIREFMSTLLTLSPAVATQARAASVRKWIVLFIFTDVRRAIASLTVMWCGVIAHGGTVTLQSLLEEMTDRDALACYPDPAYESLQASSYNRASVRRGAPGWFADSDGMGFVREEKVNGHTEWVLMEHDGPGCITHIWTPFFYYGFDNRVGPNVKITLDGSDVPVVNESLIALVTERSFVKAPFSGLTARAGNLFLPIPFSRGCKITMDGKPFYNIINYRTYPAGTEVESFGMDGYAAAAARLKDVGEILRSPPAFTANHVRRVEHVLVPGETVSLDLPEGNGAIRHLEIKLDPNQVNADPTRLRTTVLSAQFDGEETVWCPLGDFFCSGNAVNPMHTWTRTVTADGRMVCRWVMPYKEQAVVGLSNVGTVSVHVNVTVRCAAWQWDRRSMHFHANWRSDDVLPGTPFTDWNFIDIRGKGVFVGDAWTVLSPDRGWWGEGDEKIYVDGAYDDGFPTHFGTGTEDYYGWAGGKVPKREDVFSQPFLANVSVGSTVEDNPRGFNICTRIRALDAIPFETRLRFDMEASPGTQIRNPWNLLAYSSVVFWYARPGAASNRPPLPEAAAKPIVSLAMLEEKAKAIRRDSFKRIEGAIEFEGLKPSAQSDGLQCGPQRPSPAFLPDKTWSAGNHFFVAGRRAGDFVEFAFTEQFHPAELTLFVTKSYDFGVVRVSVDGKPVGDDIDLYAPRPVTEAVLLGNAVPVDNRIVLRMELVGKNRKATGSGTYMGLDCIVITPTQARGSGQ